MWLSFEQKYSIKFPKTDPADSPLIQYEVLLTRFHVCSETLLNITNRIRVGERIEFTIYVEHFH